MYAKIILMTATILLSGQTFAQTATTPTAAQKAKAKKNKKTTSTSVVAPTEPAQIVPAAVVKKSEEVPAAHAPMSTTEEIVKYLQDKVSLSYHGEFYLLRRDNQSDDENLSKLGDFQHMSIPTMVYKPTPNWQIMATAEFKYAKVPGGSDGTYNNRFHRALYTLTRKNILKEKEQGVTVDAGIGRRDYNTASAPSAWGNDRAFTTISKTYGKHSGSLFVQYLYNDPKKSSATTFKHAVEIIPTINIQLTEKLTYMFNDDFNFYTPEFKNTVKNTYFTHEMNIAYLTYTLTDKISTYYQFKYTREAGFDDSNKDYVDNYVGVIYAFTPKVSGTFEVGSRILQGRDNHSFFASSAKRPEFAIYLDAAL